MKICATCKWYRQGATEFSDDCLNPEYAKSIGVVRGNQAPSFCDPLRSDPTQCGPSGVGYEAAESQEAA